MTNAASRQNSVYLGSSLSMRSFAIEETPSPLPALCATLVSTTTFERQKSEYGQRQRQSNSFSHLEKRDLSASKDKKWCSFFRKWIWMIPAFPNSPNCILSVYVCMSSSVCFSGSCVWGQSGAVCVGWNVRCSWGGHTGTRQRSAPVWVSLQLRAHLGPPNLSAASNLVSDRLRRHVMHISCSRKGPQVIFGPRLHT